MRIIRAFNDGEKENNMMHISDLLQVASLDQNHFKVDANRDRVIEMIDQQMSYNPQKSYDLDQQGDVRLTHLNESLLEFYKSLQNDEYFTSWKSLARAQRSAHQFLSDGSDRLRSAQYEGFRPMMQASQYSEKCFSCEEEGKATSSVVIFISSIANCKRALEGAITDAAYEVKWLLHRYPTQQNTWEALPNLGVKKATLDSEDVGLGCPNEYLYRAHVAYVSPASTEWPVNKRMATAISGALMNEESHNTKVRLRRALLIKSLRGRNSLLNLGCSLGEGGVVKAKEVRKSLPIKSGPTAETAENKIPLLQKRLRDLLSKSSAEIVESIGAEKATRNAQKLNNEPVLSSKKWQHIH